MAKPGPLYQHIYEIASQVPSGRVISYGQIARMVGCGPRVVGYAMAALKSGSHPDVPWQRVINSRGRLSMHGDGVGNALQLELLLDEGICFDQEGQLRDPSYWWLGKP